MGSGRVAGMTTLADHSLSFTACSTFAVAEFLVEFRIATNLFIFILLDNKNSFQTVQNYHSDSLHQWKIPKIAVVVAHPAQSY